MPCPGGVSIAFVAQVPGDAAAHKVRHLARAGGTWGAVTEVAAYASAVGDMSTGASIGSRVAFLVADSNPEGLWLHTWDAGGGWRATRLRQLLVGAPSWAGFTPAGKVWVLSRAEPHSPAAGSGDTFLRHALYEEP